MAAAFFSRPKTELRMAALPNHSRPPLARLLGVLCAATLAAGPSLVHARVSTEPAAAEGTPSEAEALSEQAVEAFGDKRYDESIDLFEQAFALNANPNYLFNIGRVYEEKGDLAKAVEFYQRFVSQPGVDLESREAATARLKVLREAVAQLEEEEADEPEPEPQPEPVLEADNGEEPADEPADSKADRKKGQRIAGYALLGVGGASLIVGGVLGGLASSKADDADSAEFVDDALRMRDDARRQARAADAMFIAGGVFAATGLVLVLTTLGKKKGSSASTPSRRWVVAPSASPTSAGAALHGRF